MKKYTLTKSAAILVSENRDRVVYFISSQKAIGFPEIRNPEIHANIEPGKDLKNSVGWMLK